MRKNLNLLKQKFFGLSFYITNFSVVKSFGLASSRSLSHSKKKFPGHGVSYYSLEDFILPLEDKVSRAVNSTVLSNPSVFGLGLKRYLSRRIKLLKFNRSYRGVRHSQSLPVRYQRSKTNAKTQKSRRR